MKKRLISLFVLFAVLCGMAGMAGAEETETFTWWIARGEDTSYYDNYAQNPVVQYFLQDTYNGKKLDLQFWQGISGAERDNYNNMLATGDLADIIDLSYSDYTPATLYEDGYIMDLTPYVEQYMPNYWKLIHENPEVSEFAWSHVDGEKKILFITNQMVQEPFEGYCYRRDWVAKYGTNPQTGEAFTYSIDENGTWVDDVVFPCGESDPYYISDWEWMFEIFTRAMADLGITDGYCISLYYQGVLGTGDVYSGFGGGCPWWYRDSEGNAAFGGVNDTMRTYLQCMNTWWNNGWIDKSFAERSGDMFYIIDSTSVHQGKVGMWQGRQSEVGGSMDIGTEYTSGIMVYGAPQPINDIYGGEAQQNKQPDTFYEQPSLSIGPAITTKAQGKDIGVVLAFFDSLYEPERATIAHVGFSRELMAEMDDSEPWKQMYIQFGLENGTHRLDTVDGVEALYHYYVEMLLGNAMKGNRLTKGIALEVLHTDESRDPLLQDAIDIWMLYPATGYLRENVEGLISPGDTSKKSKIDNNMQTYMAQNLPKFIMGQNGYDINNDTDWENYCKVITKYGVDKVTEMYQQALDMLKE